MWGKSTSIDLIDCDKALITDAEYIKCYVKDLVAVLQMKAFGPCHVVHFGSCKEVEGFTMIQMIETSLISGHFVNIDGNAYLDIFSCKDYDDYDCAKFSYEYFKAKDFTYSSKGRGILDRIV